MTLSYKGAAARVRMTVQLLRWFARYGCNGATLAFDQDGMIEESALDSFDLSLRAKWPRKSFPAGVRAELEREARGQCGMCNDACDHLEAAHINRLNHEATFYWQHPHNLILMCPNCHTRYDSMTGSITHNVVSHRKEQLLARLLEDVQRDIALAQATEAHLKSIRDEMTVEIGKQLQQVLPTHLSDVWARYAPRLVQSINSDLSGVAPTSPIPGNATDLVKVVTAASGSISADYPVTSGLLTGLAQEVGSMPSATGLNPWAHIESETEPGQCIRCGSPAEIETYTCTSCEHEHYDLYGEEAPIRELKEDGWELTDVDEGSIECEECGNTTFEVEFSALCSYCGNPSDVD